ncbi:hypothetical protein PLICRDRAFT_34220 [Plicaturopsis crispa FD-325 SS-3]|nr:hypothetical protein PLICRDRAFT_34220 [Plicaturopsis crispa FD-325 SS-3]
MVQQRPEQLQAGLWGPHTGTTDFCEINYQITDYIAEFINTFSNVSYIILGAIGFYYIRRERLPTRVALCYACLVVIGLGSFLYHATLMRTAQMMDELPMMWEATLLLYACMATSSARPKPAFSPSLAIAHIAVAVAFCVMDFVMDNPVYHDIGFGTLVAAAIARVVYLLKTQVPPDSSARTDAPALFYKGVSMFILGFVIWNLDIFLCDAMLPLKEKLGLPWAYVLEGHAYWHVLTAFGGFYAVVGATSLCLSVEDSTDQFQIRKGIFGLPYLARITSAKEK